MTNYEQIKNMNIQEMIDFFVKYFACGTCPIYKCLGSCSNEIQDWLESEA